jgi:hypothetical protein
MAKEGECWIVFPIGNAAVPFINPTYDGDSLWVVLPSGKRRLLPLYRVGRALVLKRVVEMNFGGSARDTGGSRAPQYTCLACPIAPGKEWRAGSCLGVRIYPNPSPDFAFRVGFPKSKVGLHLLKPEF